MESVRLGYVLAVLTVGEVMQNTVLIVLIGCSLIWHGVAMG